MWYWLQFWWILPLAMMAACVFMCMIPRRVSGGGCMGPCGHRHGKEPER